MKSTTFYFNQGTWLQPPKKSWCPWVERNIRDENYGTRRACSLVSYEYWSKLGHNCPTPSLEQSTKTAFGLIWKKTVNSYSQFQFIYLLHFFILDVIRFSSLFQIIIFNIYIHGNLNTSIWIVLSLIFIGISSFKR